MSPVVDSQLTKVVVVFVEQITEHQNVLQPLQARLQCRE